MPIEQLVGHPRLQRTVGRCFGNLLVACTVGAALREDIRLDGDPPAVRRPDRVREPRRKTGELFGLTASNRQQIQLRTPPTVGDEEEALAIGRKCR
jgi:hypothetical protein